MNSSQSKPKQEAQSGNGLKEEEKILNIDALDQALWLVKVPLFIAERWVRASNDEVLGSLKLTMNSNGPNQPPTRQLNVDLDPVDHLQGPDSFTLEALNAASDSYVAFSSEINADRNFCIDGKVTKNLLLMPKSDAGYDQMVKNRALSRVGTKRVIAITEMQDTQRLAEQSHTVEFISSDKMELKRKAAAERALASGSNKQARLSAEPRNEDALKSKVFEAFEQNERLTLKDLTSFCRDTEGFSSEKELRELLDVYAKYNARGQWRHFWELKTEYRTH
ncbi:hypothetical protein B484DRAFT_45594 [Ochromonadaceae sp. CCMP2298]|nr:hypothetical protein B484DRAFT_45594 [Ochromonadaceae sp. CCMP2298]